MIAGALLGNISVLRLQRLSHGFLLSGSVSDSFACSCCVFLAPFQGAILRDSPCVSRRCAHAVVVLGSRCERQRIPGLRADLETYQTKM